MDPAAPARLWARPLLVSRHALHQPRPWADLARRSRHGAGMVPRTLAQSARHRAPLWRTPRALAARPLAHLPPPDAPHARVGSDPDRPRPRRAAPPRRARGGNAPRAHALRHGRSLHACPPLLLGGESVGGIPPIRPAPHRVDPRLHRPALLAPPAPLVPSELRRDPEHMGARAGARVARLRGGGA